jgi:hypothetical protein
MENGRVYTTSSEVVIDSVLAMKFSFFNHLKTFVAKHEHTQENTPRTSLYIIRQQGNVQHF